MIIGVDCGTVSVKISRLKADTWQDRLLYHGGEPVQRLRDCDIPSHSQVAVTGRYANLLAEEFGWTRVSAVRCLLARLRNNRSIDFLLDAGSSQVSLVELKGGRFHGYETNSLCASGTGAFLDQQMQRMNLDYSSISRIPLLPDPPSIATRCAVFAKSDLIHRQQQGYTIDQLWNGLVKGVADTCCATLFRGRNVTGTVLLIGGMAANTIFSHYLRANLAPAGLDIPQAAVTFLARAAARFLASHPDIRVSAKGSARSIRYETPLLPVAGQAGAAESFSDNWQNEVDIWQPRLPKEATVYLGVDVGSTSTKLAALTADGSVLLSIYNRTRARPIAAFQRLLKGCRQLCRERSIQLQVAGLGITGSGRKLVGMFAGADLIKNEITAHLKGAMRLKPDVRTIFEIGGQDSKYILVEKGWMKDANMNYVCAAGTGSFIEEQAALLQVPLADIATLCAGVAPPAASDRCTVFMEQDALQQLQTGYDKRQVLASILYAVAKNYLHKVVHNRPVEGPLLFLGATAKNKGLVSAFQNILGMPVHTSPFSHVTGAIGCADMVRRNPPQKTRFKGFNLAERSVNLTERTCTLCSNRCIIQVMRVQGEQGEVSWGHRCGRDGQKSHKRRLPGLAHLRYLRQQLFTHQADYKRDVYLPMALHAYTFMPLWRAFFNGLGIGVRLPRGADETGIAETSARHVSADFCYPVKRAIGQGLWACQNHDLPVFLPHLIRAEKQGQETYFCPLSQSLPSLVASSLRMQGNHSERLLSPVIDFSVPDAHNITALHACLAPVYGTDRRAVRSAFLQAKGTYTAFRNKLLGYGNQVCRNHDPHTPLICILGRSYNVLDPRLNLRLLERFAGYGYTILPMDLLPAQAQQVRHNYWLYGQRIMAAARYIKARKGMYAVYLTNFNCGPDSFLLNYFEDLLADEPYLILELDEHGGDAGYLTRIEAFLDRLKPGAKKAGQTAQPRVRVSSSHLDGQPVYIPPIHPIGTRLFAAAMQGFGINALPVTQESSRTYALGKEHVRGSECMPATSALGAFLNAVDDRKNGDSLVFMPCTNGPCRFGQYHRLYQTVFDDMRLNARVYSPNAADDYGDITGGLRLSLVRAVIITDILGKLQARWRPYEQEPGRVDRLIDTYTTRFCQDLAARRALLPSLRALRRDLLQGNYSAQAKPLVGIVGEIYLRNSPFCNNNLVHSLEELGGETWTSSTLEWFQYTAFLKRRQQRYLWGRLLGSLSLKALAWLEHRYGRVLDDLLADRPEPDIASTLALGSRYLPVAFQGEAILTVGRCLAFMQQGVDLVINVSPFSCMPGTIASAILRQVANQQGTPVVSLFYDEDSDFSHILQTYLENSPAKNH